MIVANFLDLQNAILSQEKSITIKGTILCYHSFILPENTEIKGIPGEVSMLSFNVGDGIGLTSNNTVSDLIIQVNPSQKAIYITISKTDIGKFVLKNLTVMGQVSLITRTGTEKADLWLENIDIVSSDSRHYSEQPQKYGVNVYQGALTVYNFNGDTNSNITLHAENITIGRKNAPVIGSGIFISGFGDNGGWVTLNKLTTGAVYSNGMLPFGTADMITAAVFIVYGVRAKEVTHHGEIVTYGVNDMVLDTWGEVDTWTSHKPIISYGPSGIGFVNFGTVKNFIVNADIVTHGLGARGYNQYDGTVENISFQNITTYGDGSIGIQISKPIGSLTVNGNITTYGSVGNTLVKGVIMQLPADGLSIKPGGEVKNILVTGNIVTHGDNVCSYQVDAGKVDQILVKGKIIANGKNSQTVSMINGGSSPEIES